MVDTVSEKTRSRMMSGIRGKDTIPELLIRSGLHKRGFRFRLHYGQLPGKPDLVFPKYRAIILINGCFWHGHNCHLFSWPTTRTDFWRRKITANQVRDERNIVDCQRLGWRTLTIWECAIKGKRRMDADDLTDRAAEWLASSNSNAELKGVRT